MLCAVIEPYLLLAAGRAPDRRRFVRAGLAALALGSLVLVVAPSAWVAALALALSVPLWSAGLGTGQAALIEAAPEQVERLMTRWTLSASLGDLGAPALLGLAALVGAGWRATFVVVTLLAIGLAALVRPMARPAPPEPREPDADAEPHADAAPSTFAVLARALRQPRLVAWVAGTWLCTLLDEIFVAFAVLGLEQRFAAGAGARALVLAAFLGGGALALVVVERVLLRVDGRRLLALLSASGVVIYLAWLAAPSLGWSIVGAGLLGLTTSGQHPLAKAQAYRAAPGQAATVNALDAVFASLDVALPFALAWLAARAGVTAALLVLVAQPLVLAVLALFVPPRAPRAG